MIWKNIFILEFFLHICKNVPAYFMSVTVARSPSGKARDFESRIRWFESSPGSQKLWTPKGDSGVLFCPALDSNQLVRLEKWEANFCKKLSDDYSRTRSWIWNEMEYSSENIQPEQIVLWTSIFYFLVEPWFDDDERAEIGNKVSVFSANEEELFTKWNGGKSSLK